MELADKGRGEGCFPRAERNRGVSSGAPRYGRPRPEQDGSTISASRGQEGGQGQVKIERHFQYSPVLFIESDRNRLSLRGSSPRCCGLGFAGKPAWDGVFRVLNNKGKRGCAPCVPLPAGGDRAAREGRKWREPPFLLLSCGTGQGNDIHADIHPFPMPLGVAPSTVISAGRLSSGPRI